MLDAVRRPQERSRPAALLPLPRVWPVRPSDVGALVALNGLLIVAMWVRHGGLEELGTLSGILTAIGQVTALLGTYAVLLQLVLMSRAPFLDQVFGMDRLAWYHRWLGFATIWLLVAHGVFTTVGYAMGADASIVSEFIKLITTYDYVLLALAGMACFVAVGVSSVRAARRRVSYETWYGIHLYVYLGIALAFLHQLAVGADFVDDPMARAYWIAMYVGAIGLLAAYRLGAPVLLNLHHRLVVDRVVREAPGVVSIHVKGRDLGQLAVRSGQYFLWRFLTPDGWYRAHPFSLSAAPNGHDLRITVKDLGDWTHELQTVPVGTRVFVEGPYGVMTGAKRSRERVLLIAGGIGVTPIRAMLESFWSRPGDITMLIRAKRPQELVFRDEIDALARARGANIHYIVGQRGERGVPFEPLGAGTILRLAPDVTDRDVYLCGPEPMMLSVRESLRDLGVPEAQVHWERFAY